MGRATFPSSGQSSSPNMDMNTAIQIAANTKLSEIQKVRNRLMEPTPPSLSLGGMVSIPSDNYSPLVNHLISLDHRFKLYSGMLDQNDMIAFEVNKDGILIFCGLPNLLHEIAHWVEMKDPKRWLLPNWDLATFACGFREPSANLIFAGFARELRVRGIQAHLLKSNISLLNPFWNSMANKCLPFGKFKTAKEVDDWGKDLFDRTYRAWNKDRIEYEFKIRLRAAQEFMERKEISEAA